jgi:hypothetical protein
MNLNFDRQFDVYKFYKLGFNIGILPVDLVKAAKDIIKETNFSNFVFEDEHTIKNKKNLNLKEQDIEKGPTAANWAEMPMDTFSTIISPNNLELKRVHTINDFPYEEQLRDLYCYNTAPAMIKELANRVIETSFFDPLRASLVKDNLKQTTWLRTIKSFTFGLWNGTEDLPWHNDVDDCCNMMILMYFNDYPEWKPEWKGQIGFGKEQEDGSIKEIYQHYPIDSTFVCLNNFNPLMRHMTTANDYTKNRYTFNFKFKFE